MSEDSNVTTLPVDVDLDLDAAERPAKDVKPKFRVRIGGKPIEFEDPELLDWKDLLDITEPVGFLRYSVSAEDRTHILGQDMPAWKLGRLMESYQKHYGFEEKVAQARQQARLQGIG